MRRGRRRVWSRGMGHVSTSPSGSGEAKESLTVVCVSVWGAALEDAEKSRHTGSLGREVRLPITVPAASSGHRAPPEPERGSPGAWEAELCAPKPGPPSAQLPGPPGCCLGLCQHWKLNCVCAESPRMGRTGFQHTAASNTRPNLSPASPVTSPE